MTPPEFNVSCPREGPSGDLYDCNVTVPTPVIINSQLGLAGLPNGTQALVPRPIGAEQVPDVRNPTDLLPSQDCTDMSFTHPDWTMEDDAIYIPNAPGTDLNSSSLSFTISSRATGVKAFCTWGGNHTALQWDNRLGWGSRTTFVMECLLAAGSALDPSRSVFSVEYTSAQKILRIQQDWICGDTQGAHTYDNPDSVYLTLRPSTYLPT